MPEVRLILGPPASGKTAHTEYFVKQGHVRLNRDTEGGKIIDLLSKMKAALSRGKSVVMDNLFPTAEVRKPFVEAAKAVGAEVHAHFLETSIEDAQINALHRMWAKYGCIFLTAEDIKAHPKAKNDPGVFPISVFFKYRKAMEKPSVGEGYSTVERIKFVRQPLGNGYQNKAIIFDYDGTLRDSNGPKDWPEKPEEVVLLPSRKKVVQHLKSEGDYLLLGVSNQSAVAKGLPIEAAKACFDQTNQLLGVDIPYYFCPHRIPPAVCYCRKPQSGLGVLLIETYKLNPSECIFVGDQTSDKTFAQRLGFHFTKAQDFF